MSTTFSNTRNLCICKGQSAAVDESKDGICKKMEVTAVCLPNLMGRLTKCIGWFSLTTRALTSRWQTRLQLV